MPTDRDKLTSIQYWNISDERKAQRYYIAFCLLVAAIQDCFLGRWERERDNLNWAATCYYYSLVHLGRLLCFLGVGDFPTSHAMLRYLLHADSQNRSNRKPSKYPFDWLKAFERYNNFRKADRIQTVTVQPSQNELRNVIVEYLESIGLADARNQLFICGKRLFAAGPLRNDSNYEALLIAHEYQHIEMSSAFHELSRAMEEAAVNSLLLGCQAFSSFVTRDKTLESRREEFLAFTAEYVRRRIIEAISRKIRDNICLVSDLRSLAGSIVPKHTGGRYDDIEEMVSLEVFDSKSALMEDFRQKIHALAKISRTEGGRLTKPRCIP